MNSSVKSISPVITEVAIEISKEEVNKALDKAYAQLGRTAQIKGFRKGKAPRAVLRRMFSDAVLTEVRSDLVGNHLKAALEEHDIQPVSQPELDPDELQENAPFSFTVTFQTRQKIEKIESDAIELERRRLTIQPEQITEELERLRSTMAEVIELEEPRPAQVGDLAKLYIKAWMDGEWKEGPWTNRDVAIGETPIEKQVEDAIIGLSVGEEKVVEIGDGDADSDAELDKEKERTRYLVKLELLRGRKLADLDDEFAKDMGDYETLDALKQDIENRLLETAQTEEDQRLQGILFEQLREKNPMEIPPGLLEQQKSAFAMRLQSSLAMLGDKAPPEEEREKMYGRAEKAAKEMVHQHLLMLECARLENIEIAEEDVDAEISKIAQMHGYPEPMVKAEYAKEGRREELHHQLLEKKIFDLMLTKVKITEIDPPTAPAEPAPEDKA